MRWRTLRDFSISSERKLEHRAGGNGRNLIYFRSFHKFFHGRMVVLIFQLPDWGIMVLDCIRYSKQLLLSDWYPSLKQWIHLELKPISMLKWGLSDLCGICAIQHQIIWLWCLLPVKEKMIQGLYSNCKSCVLPEYIDCWGFVSESNGELVREEGLFERDGQIRRGAFQMC